MLSAFSQAWASWKTAPGVALLAVVAFAVGIGSVNAGHNPPFLFRAGRSATADAALPDIEQLTVGGTVVGMFPEMEYEEATVELWPGDVLLAFTDGVPEAHNPENEEFGDERLQQLLRQTAHLPTDEISARLSGEMTDWIRDAEQYDDLTFIVMKVR